MLLEQQDNSGKYKLLHNDTVRKRQEFRGELNRIKHAEIQSEESISKHPVGNIKCRLYVVRWCLILFHMPIKSFFILFR